MKGKAIGDGKVLEGVVGERGLLWSSEWNGCSLFLVLV